MQNKILHYLKTAEGYFSGEEISRHLKISRAGIWKYMQELRQDGYEIAAVPHLGYRLISCPDKLIPVEIQHGLGTKILGRNIEHYDSIPSTMDAAFQMGMAGAGEGTVVCAEHQSKGKGRLGRNWLSPKGKGIYMSVLLRPKMAPTEAARLTLLSAVAVCEALQRQCQIKADIKWPNDVLVRDKKVAGILTELNAEMDRVRFVVVGIGVNVNTPFTQLPSTATSLRQESGRKISRIELLQEILRSLERWYKGLTDQGFASAMARWKELSSTLGQQVRVADQSGHVEGKAVDIDEYGGLVIRASTGLTVRRMTGDVVQT